MSRFVKKRKVYKSAERYITQLSEVDRDVPPQAPTGHSMASIIQFQVSSYFESAERNQNIKSVTCSTISEKNYQSLNKQITKHKYNAI